MNYIKLSKSEQKSIADRFVLPSDTSKLQVTNEGTPVEIIHGCRVACTLKHSALIGEGFHNHGVMVNS